MNDTEVVPRSSVPNEAKIIGSHIRYLRKMMVVSMIEFVRGVTMILRTTTFPLMHH